MLIRMISGISKWDGSKAVNRKDYYICGDAIGDLRTTDNKLSVWKADTQEDINDAIVALALNRDSVSKLSYFLLKEEDLDFLAESAHADACAPGNPKDASVEDLKALFRKLM